MLDAHVPKYRHNDFSPRFWIAAGASLGSLVGAAAAFVASLMGLSVAASAIPLVIGSAAGGFCGHLYHASLIKQAETQKPVDPDKRERATSYAHEKVVQQPPPMKKGASSSR
jgi:hypothetical protein